ncbi:ARM repeat-containing protein [Venustampulla echinocandica]|uniref:ARM repeat-containing protein n=1 Tax=Venustampulla echinocandica TaxID=2656787 RepID=A0A370U2T5_9HELO|nr:ARM repeat-containing protein [Venustampulla echinocandica]RDL42081.1 ARM repeat-containing protein [Venustampulla echinocandica]
MPAATTKTAMAGTKRKLAPSKDVYVKDSKKAKVGSNSKSALKQDKRKSTAKPVVKVKELSVSDSDDSESEGGAPLESNQTDGDEEGSDLDDSPNAIEGLHPERAKAAATNSQSSKEAHQKQKLLVNQRKAAKPMADELARTKQLWERLRRKSHVPAEERKKLVAELFDIITGRIKDFVLKHDSVRVVQTALKYSTPAQKRMIANELAGTYRQLAESKYAKFLIGKLLVQGDAEIRDLIVPEFFGHVRRLIRHPEASWILDDIYRGVATKQQKAVILREWYGAEFALFKEDKPETAELSEILAVDPGKRAPIMSSLFELINHLVQKKLTGFTLLHDAMLQYFLNAKPGTEEVTDYIELIKGDEEGDLLKNLAFTRSGSRLVSLVLAHGTAKDRKHILKTYKDTMQMMAGDANGHIIILTVYDVIDDTVLTSKSVFPELLSKDADQQIENISLAANDLNARLPLLYLFEGRSRALFPPSHSADLEILSELDTIRKTTSKKDPEIRRSELVKAISPYLLKPIETAAADLVASPFGCQFITAVLLGAEGEKSAALQAIAETASGDPTFIQPPPEEQEEQEGQEASDAEPPASHVSATASGGRMLKSLIAGGRFDSKTKTIIPTIPALNFADILYPHIKDHIIDWATGPSSFVVVALTESDNFSKKDELLKVLKASKKKLEKSAKEETDEQKSRREAAQKALEGGEGKLKAKKAKKAKGGKEREVGNKGAAILLQKL